jgi:hypothetical protein
MNLIDVVNAHIAATEMESQPWPYEMALALMKIKRQTQDETRFFIEKEQELVKKYAALDKDGNVRMTPKGTFIFRNPKDGPDYERGRQELGETESGARQAPARVKAPEQITPQQLSALLGFIEFIETSEDA